MGGIMGGIMGHLSNGNTKKNLLFLNIVVQYRRWRNRVLSDYLQQQYFLLLRGGAFAACCCSPKKDSNCGQIVELLTRLSDAIKNNDSKRIESLISSADELSRKFEALYPDDVKEGSVFLLWQ